MTLEANSYDWETLAEQTKERDIWIDLGYRVEAPKYCLPTKLSNGKQCVYGLIVFLPQGVCGQSVEQRIDWRKRNYIGIVAYAQSIGYDCTGYRD